jgi:hypothetical protein
MLLFFGALNACGELLEGHAINTSHKMLLEKLLVAMVIRWAQQLTRNRATVDHLKVTFWRLHFDLFDVEKLVEVVRNDVVDRIFFRSKREVPWDGIVKLCQLLTFYGLGRNDHDVAVWLFEEQVCDIE